ncbi:MULTISPECIES: PTS transporter subunit EIIC [unclassified Streptococcus]|uniref:PTS transporter subunit EIIC n=1 Tax=unclassified Streptococcus TaxID=2608887 RepID=UPI000A6EB7CB|nr:MULTISPECIES: PTS transporter subunit EIIC [unclassified Streptococcus]
MEKGSSLKVRVQKLGTTLSNMVMPNIPALIAWGVLTALFIPDGYLPNAAFALIVSPMLVYLIPTLIGFTGGKNVYDHRGGVVGAIATATFGAIAGTQGGLMTQSLISGLDPAKLSATEFVEQYTDILANGKPNVTMIIGAMIMGPLGAWCIKKFDEAVQPKIKSGFEMLVNDFSAGLIAFALMLIAYAGVGPVVAYLTEMIGQGVQAIVNVHLLPLASILIEPAKVLFLNNALNHGIFTPLGTEQVAKFGQSVFFLLEANSGPGLGILLAYAMFGKGSAKSSSWGAMIIHFFGGIHEIYFP